MGYRLAVYALLCCGALVACTAPGASADLSLRLAAIGYRMLEDNQRIPSYPVSGWTPVDSRNLIIMAGVNDHYLVSLNRSCSGLNTAFRVGFTTPGPRSRVDRFDNLVMRSANRGKQRCQIRNIFRLTKL